MYLLVGGLARKLTVTDDEIRVHAFLAMTKIADVVGLKERGDPPISKIIFVTIKYCYIKLNGQTHASNDQIKLKVDLKLR